MSLKTREVHLARRPDGAPALDDFRLVEAPVPEIGEGQVLIRQLYMSVDPAMRPRLSAGYELDQVMAGGALGRIVASNSKVFAAMLNLLNAKG